MYQMFLDENDTEYVANKEKKGRQALVSNQPTCECDFADRKLNLKEEFRTRICWFVQGLPDMQRILIMYV